MSPIDAVIDGNPKVPRVWITALHVSGGGTVSLSEGDIVLLVGPNNAGKSALLRDIHERFQQQQFKTTVLTALEFATAGTPEDIEPWLQRLGRITQDSIVHLSNGGTASVQILKTHWAHIISTHGPLALLRDEFFRNLTTDTRLQSANPVVPLAFVKEPVRHPLHYLYLDEDLEQFMSGVFRKGFGADLMVNRMGGNQIALHGRSPASQDKG